MSGDNPGALDSFKINAMNGGGAGAGGDQRWLKDQQMGAGMSLQNMGPLKGNAPGGVYSDKGTGFKDKNGGLWKGRATFEGFEAVTPAEVNQGEAAAIYGEAAERETGSVHEAQPMEQAPAPMPDAPMPEAPAAAPMEPMQQAPVEAPQPAAGMPGMGGGSAYGDSGGAASGGTGSSGDVYGDSGSSGATGGGQTETKDAGMVIMQHGGYYIGSLASDRLTGMDAIQPAATPGMGKSQDMGMGV